MKLTRRNWLAMVGGSLAALLAPAVTAGTVATGWSSDFRKAYAAAAGRPPKIYRHSDPGAEDLTVVRDMGGEKPGCLVLHRVLSCCPEQEWMDIVGLNLVSSRAIGKSTALATMTDFQYRRKRIYGPFRVVPRVPADVWSKSFATWLPENFDPQPPHEQNVFGSLGKPDSHLYKAYDKTTGEQIKGALNVCVEEGWYTALHYNDQGSAVFEKIDGMWQLRKVKVTNPNVVLRPYTPDESAQALLAMKHGRAIVKGRQAQFFDYSHVGLVHKG